MKIKPYEHQRNSLDEIHEAFRVHKSVLFTLATGGGKAYMLSFLVKEMMEKGRVKNALILVDKEELLLQLKDSLNEIGLTVETVTADKKQTHKACDVFVAMIETAYNRVTKQPDFFGDIDFIMVDEAHILKFDKIFDSFRPDTLRYGCTATPVTQKKIYYSKCERCGTEYPDVRECCFSETMEWVRPFTLSELYETIVVGQDVDELIMDGKLVKEIAFKKEWVNVGDLTQDNSTESGYTEKSINDAYGSKEALFNVILNYEEICKDKRTIIFNANTKQNKLVYEQFLSSGYSTDQVKMYDSVNGKENTEDRKEIIKWFKETPNGILLNVACFTTGLDVPTIQTVIVNRPIGSLSLWIQIAGRGGRTTKDIFKDHFILIDGGGNIDRFGLWSAPRDWESYFYGSNTEDKPKARKESIMNVDLCESCGFLKAKSAGACPSCGKMPVPKTFNQEVGEEVMKPIEVPYPNGLKILEYTKHHNADLNFAWGILINQVVDMFKYYLVSRKTYLKTLENGKLDERISAIVRKCYFVLANSDLEGGTNRTLKYLNGKIKKKLEKHYAV